MPNSGGSDRDKDGAGAGPAGGGAGESGEGLPLGRASVEVTAACAAPLLAPPVPPPPLPACRASMLQDPAFCMLGTSFCLLVWGVRDGFTTVNDAGGWRLVWIENLWINTLFDNHKATEAR